MEEKMRELELYLEGMVNIRSLQYRPDEFKGLKYTCFEEAVLADGVRFRRGKVDNVPKMTPKMCFNNAYDLLVNSDDLFYCEGYAAGIIGVHHAWLCDADGRIYDPTWWQDYHDGEDDVYIGLIFDTEYVLEQALRTGVAGMFYQNDWSPNMDILRGEARLAEVNLG